MSDETTEDLTDQHPLNPVLLPDQEQGLRAIHQSLTMIFRQEVESMGGAEMWLTSRCPMAHASLGTATTDPAVLEQMVLGNTQAFWTGHEARLGECAGCPKDGAACADSSERVRPGILVKLRADGAVALEMQRPCERYQDYRIAKRLESVGVDKRLCRVKIQHLSREPLPHVIKAFDVFIASGEGKHSPSKQILIEGHQAREYAVALFRSATRNFQNATFKSVHVPSLERAAKNAMTVKDQSPMTELTELDVVLLDSVGSDALSSGWFRKELIWVYERRRDQGLATIITASVPAKEAFPGVSVLRV